MTRRIIHIVLWLILAFWFSVMMGFVAKSNHELLCKQISVDVSDSLDTRFVTDLAIRKLIQTSEMNVQGYALDQIRTRDLEFLIEKNPYVKNAEVYTDVEGTLFVDIEQRKPLVRIMPGGKEGFYIDRNGVILPLSEHYSPMVILVTGSIQVTEVNDSTGVKRADVEADQEIGRLLDFADYVGDHPFWRNQVVQVYRKSNGDYELIPRVGAHQIIFGDMDDYRLKLRNLKLLYEQGFSKYGWNTYDIINIKYSNQIICTKR